VPRNVVTLVPRILAFPTRRNRETRRRIESRIVERYRARIDQEANQIEIDFPKRLGGRAAKTQVMEELDRTDPRWRQVFVLYPTESALRDKGE